MKQQDVFKKIGGIITEINEQYQYLQSVNGVSNDLELELLMANAHFLSDHIEILRKLNAQAAKAQEAAVKETPTPEVKAQPVPEVKPEPAPEPKPEPLPEPQPEPKHTPEPQYFQPFASEPEELEEEAPAEVIEEPENAPVFEFEIDNQINTPEEAVAPEPEPAPIRHELTLEDIGEDWDEDEDEPDTEEIAAELAPEEAETVKAVPATPIPEPVSITPEPVIEEQLIQQPEAKPQPAPEPPVKHTQIMVAEEEIITINQKMSAKMGTQRMSDQLIGSPIGDLKSAITLNDKLLYIRELFNGYSLAYSEALDLMNRMQSFEEAQTFLKNSYSTKNNWADKQAVADKFYALLQRRYL